MLRATQHTDGNRLQIRNLFMQFAIWRDSLNLFGLVINIDLIGERVTRVPPTRSHTQHTRQRDAQVAQLTLE